MLLTVSEAMDRYNLSRYSTMILAEEHDAIVRISDRIVRVSKAKLDTALGISDGI